MTQEMESDTLQIGEVSIRKSEADETTAQGYVIRHGLDGEGQSGNLFQPHKGGPYENEFERELLDASDHLGITVDEIKQKLNNGEEIRYSVWSS